MLWNQYQNSKKLESEYVFAEYKECSSLLAVSFVPELL